MGLLSGIARIAITFAKKHPIIAGGAGFLFLKSHFENKQSQPPVALNGQSAAPAQIPGMPGMPPMGVPPGQFTA